MKRYTTHTIFLACLLAAGLIMAGCENPADNDPPFVEVKNITGIPTTGVAGRELTLTGTLTPADATNQTIAWTVKDPGGTGAVFDDEGKLTTTGAGKVTVTATIEDGKAPGTPYTKDFSITITAAFVPVTDITDVPTEGAAKKPLDLTGTVAPEEATYQDIVWKVMPKGTTAPEAKIATNTNTLTNRGTGTVVVKATIKNGMAPGRDWTKEYTITIGVVPVEEITDVPTEGIVNQPLTLSGTVVPDDASYKTIRWSVKDAGDTGAEIRGKGTLTASGTGTVTVKATIEDGTMKDGEVVNYTEDFTITITFVPVTGITITTTPTSGIVDQPLTLNATVAPQDASYKDIVWSVKQGDATEFTPIDENTFTPDTLGTWTVKATIENGTAVGTPYTQEANINIGVKAVTGITEVPTSWKVNIPMTLSGTVKPDDATYKDIVWSTAPPNNITGNELTSTVAGTVVVTATIEDGLAVGTPYTKTFPITIAFEPVTAIAAVVPTSGTVGTALTLSGTVYPWDASYQAIVWTVTSDGGTGASIIEGIEGTTLSTNAAGTVVVTATIKNGTAPGVDFTQPFTITIIVPVTDITGVPEDGVATVNLALTGTVKPDDATNQTIAWTVKDPGGTGAPINGTPSVLTTTAAGTVVVTATIANGKVDNGVIADYTKDFTIVIYDAPPPLSRFTGFRLSGIRGPLYCPHGGDSIKGPCFLRPRVPAARAARCPTAGRGLP